MNDLLGKLMVLERNETGLRWNEAPEMEMQILPRVFASSFRKPTVRGARNLI